MIPPRFVPPGILQLYEVVGEQNFLIEEMPSSSKNRLRIQQIRNDLLMVDPSRTLAVTENNSVKFSNP
jgi:hypothetical protein